MRLSAKCMVVIAVIIPWAVSGCDATPPSSIGDAAGAPAPNSVPASPGDRSAEIQRRLETEGPVVDLGGAGVITASVTVPAGVTVRAYGTTFEPPIGAQYVMRTGGPGVRIDGVAIDATHDSGLKGGEAAIFVAHSDVSITGTRVVGNGFRYGVYIEAAGPLKNVDISGNTFWGTSYGVLKAATMTEDLRIEQNSFVDIRRGDAVELNTGGEVGTRVTGNIIQGVRQDGVMHAGIGIGIAGQGDYGVPLQEMTSGCLIADNRLSDVENEAIHIEVMARCNIRGNTVQGGGFRTAVGIAMYGSQENHAQGNAISGVVIGILDGIGYIDGSPVRSSSGNSISENLVSECATGIASTVTGAGTSVSIERNSVSHCEAGVEHSGATAVTMVANSVRDSPRPYVVDLQPLRTLLLSSGSRSLVFVGNAASTNGQPAPQPLHLRNSLGAAVTQSDTP